MAVVPLLAAVPVNSFLHLQPLSRTPQVMLVTRGLDHLARFLGLVLWVKSTIRARNLGGLIGESLGVNGGSMGAEGMSS